MGTIDTSVPRKATATGFVLLLLASSFCSIAIGSSLNAAPALIIGEWSFTDASPRYADDIGWPMSGGGPSRDSHTGSKMPATSEIAWSEDRASAVLTEPVVHDNLLFIGIEGSGQLQAINASTGDPEWTADLGADPSTPAVRGQIVYVGTADGTLWALNITNGGEEWNMTAASGPLEDVLVYNVAITATCDDGTVRTYDPWGQELWNVTGLASKIGPATGHGGMVLVPADDRIYGFNATDGTPAGNIVIAPSTALSGIAIWRGEDSGDTADDRAVIAVKDGVLSMVWLNNFTVNWSVSPVNDLNVTPSIVGNIASMGGGGMVIVPQNDMVTAYNASTGKEMWTTNLTDTAVTSAVLTDDGVAIGLANGSIDVLTYDISGTGPSWTFSSTSAGDVTGLGLAYQRLFATTENGLVFVLGKRPKAHVELVLPEHADFDDPVQFRGHGSQAGSFKSYKWRSSIDGVFAVGPDAFNTSFRGLSVGQHVVYFQVQDDNWTWSPEVATAVTVNQSDQWEMFRHDHLRTGAVTSVVPDTASIKWKTHFTSNAMDITSSPAISGNRVFIGGRDHYIYSLNVNTGATIWSMQAGGAIDSSPAIVGNMLFFGCDDGRLYAMDPDPTDDPYDDGEFDDGNHLEHDVIWRFDAGDSISAAPAVAGGTVYITTSPGTGGQPKYGKLFAVNLNGNEVWHYTIPNPFPVYSSPAVDEKNVYFGANDGDIYAIDRDTGESAWPSAFHTGGAVLSTPTVTDDTIIIGSNDGSLYALWKDTGTLRWRFDASGTSGNEVQSSPVVAGDLVYAGSRDNKLYAVHVENGTEAWNHVTGDDILSSPTVVGDRVMIPSVDGYFYMLNATDGKLVWKWGAPPEIEWFSESSPAVANGLILVGAGKGYLIAIGDAPDFSLKIDATPDIKLVPSQPRVGINTRVLVGVHNIGTVDGNVSVNFYETPFGYPTNHIASKIITVNTSEDVMVEFEWGPAFSVKTSLTVNLTLSTPIDLNSFNDEIIYLVDIKEQAKGWRMFGNDPQHTGTLNDGLNMPNSNLTAWMYNTGGTIRTSPVVADGYIYIASGNRLLCLLEDPPDPESVKPIWTYDLGGPVSSTPAVANSLVFVATSAGKLHALDSFTGDEVWNRSMAVGSSAPTVVNMTLYIGTQNGEVMSIDTDTGDLRWEKNIGASVDTSPAVMGDMVVVTAKEPDGNSSVIAMSIKEHGEPVWWYTGENGMPATATIAYSDSWGVDIVLVSDEAGHIFAFELQPNGSGNLGDNVTDRGKAYDLIWSYFDNKTVRASIAIIDDTMIVPTGNSTMVSIDVETGERNWRRKFANPVGTNLLSSSPSIADEKVFVGADGIYCLDLVTGQQIWKLETDGWSSSSPALNRGQVFTASRDGTVYAFAKNTTRSPIASIRSPANASSFRIGEDIIFDASSSVDEDGVIRNHKWDMGNNIVAEGAIVRYRYHEEDLELSPVTVTLTVTDNDGRIDRTNITVHLLPNEAPLLSDAYLDPITYDEGDDMVVRVTFSDKDNDTAAFVKAVFNDKLLDDMPREFLLYPLVDNITNVSYINGVVYGTTLNGSNGLPSGNYTLSFTGSDKVEEYDLKTALNIRVWREENETRYGWTPSVKVIGRDVITIYDLSAPDSVSSDSGNYTKVADSGAIIELKEGNFHEMKEFRARFDLTGTNMSEFVTSTVSAFRKEGSDWIRIEEALIGEGNITIDLAGYGNEVYLCIYAKKLPTNLIPAAKLSVTSGSRTVEAGQTITFSALESTYPDRSDPDRSILFKDYDWTEVIPDDPTSTKVRFIWDFGDGKIQSGYNESNGLVSHKYSKAGTFFVTLKVVDPYGAKSENLAMLQITVRQAESNEMLLVLILVIVAAVIIGLFWPTKEEKEKEPEEKKDLKKEEKEEEMVAKEEEKLGGDEEEEEEDEEEEEEGDEEEEEENEEERNKTRSVSKKGSKGKAKRK